jgi:hypothetical protein
MPIEASGFGFGRGAVPIIAATGAFILSNVVVNQTPEPKTISTGHSMEMIQLGAYIPT